MKKIIVLVLIAILLGRSAYINNHTDIKVNSNKNQEEIERSVVKELVLKDKFNNVSTTNLDDSMDIQEGEDKNIPQGKYDINRIKDAESTNGINKNNGSLVTVNANNETEEDNKSEGKDNEGDRNSRDEIKIELAISEDTIKNAENSLSLADKAKAIKLIITKLSEDDIKLLKDMVVGGLTKEEQSKVIELVYSKYTEEELKLVKSLYKKYMGN